ncbi:hypothetical protein JDV02_000840 [Purpureocillium takamizusanense]|uniref:G-protein coupled receptors family 1 profile domain-containing protein n=1 Tax=Purpureocillium takamizusanense TaxID=2060973 RepID=A0A9Q8Q5T3_9HYPO|nr:uncharacterized protein JDV02_000840 [Purpureocillium takamizusanense]UNI14183.1 hypothetical protein JDV02_000840 [Purpureocillium takamizusanense]
MDSLLANAKHVGDALVVPVPSLLAQQPTSLTVNLGFRVALGIIADLVCLVPFWILARNGEFAASLYVLNIIFLNLDTVVNSLIWRNNDTASWWPGFGFCDLDNFFRNGAKALFLTCLLAIMRNLAIQVGRLRANPLSIKERRRRILVQALIIFPWPLSVIAWTYPLAANRYVIGTLSGCDWSTSSSWPYLVFFVIPPPVVAAVTLAYSVLIFFRFRQLSRTNEPALSTNSTIHRRSVRTRRRLYLMVVSIIVPFFPIVIALTVLNIIDMGALEPFNYDLIHNPPGLFPWNTIGMLPSDQVSWGYRNTQYIAILTAIPIFGFFGTTRDAVNIYRKGLLMLRLGRIFPGLNEVYDPDKSRSGSGSYGSTATTTTRGGSTVTSGSTAYSHALKSLTPSTNNTRRDSVTRGPEPAVSDDVDVERGEEPAAQHLHQSAEPGAAGAHETIPNPIHRNPFPFRTHFNLHLPWCSPSSRSERATAAQGGPDRPVSYGSQASTTSHPRILEAHDEEARLSLGWVVGEQSRDRRARVDSEFTSTLLHSSANQGQ